MNPKNVSNTALALAKLRCGDGRLFATLVGAALGKQLLVAQDFANLCWALAVADQRQLSAAVVELCRRLAGQCWGGTVLENYLVSGKTTTSCTRCTCGC